MMKAYAQFLTTDLSGKIVEALGSDGVFILDGRNNLETMNNDATERMNKLRKVQPHYIGYRIYRGERIADGNKLIAEVIN